jgi:lipoprotein-releasing system permease protein
MSFTLFVAKRILKGKGTKNNISTPIVKIGVIGIALGVSVMILTLAIVTGFQKQITNKITTFTAHLQINDYDETNSLEPTPIEIKDSVIKKIKSQENILHIQPYAIKNGILKTKTENEGIILKGVNKTFNWNLLNPYIVEGKTIQFSDSNSSKDIFISKTLAEKLNLKLNQKLIVYFITKKKLTDTTFNGDSYINYEARTREFYVCGIFNTGFSDFDKNLVFVDLKQIQKINYWNKNEVAGYEIYLNNLKKLETTQENVNELVGFNYNVSNMMEKETSIFSWLDMIDVNAEIIITLMVLVAAINMISALLILILERTNLIGILKALGLNNSDTKSIFFHISIRLLLKGLIIGNIIGIGICLLQQQFNFLKLNPATYYLESVPINLSIIHLLLINLGTIICCLLMMYLPTFILNKITPLKAIRFS